MITKIPKMFNFLFCNCFERFSYLLIVSPFFFQFSTIASENCALELNDPQCEVRHSGLIYCFGFEYIGIQHQPALVNHIQEIFLDVHSGRPPALQEAERGGKKCANDHEKRSPFSVLTHVWFWLMAIPLWIVCYLLAYNAGHRRFNRSKDQPDDF